MPTSNWNGLTCQPMSDAAAFGRKTWKAPAQSPVTPIGSSKIHDRRRSATGSSRRVAAANTSAITNSTAGRFCNKKRMAEAMIG